MFSASVPPWIPLWAISEGRKAVGNTDSDWRSRVSLWRWLVDVRHRASLALVLLFTHSSLHPHLCSDSVISVRVCLLLFIANCLVYLFFALFDPPCLPTGRVLCRFTRARFSSLSRLSTQFIHVLIFEHIHDTIKRRPRCFFAVGIYELHTFEVEGRVSNLEPISQRPHAYYTAQHTPWQPLLRHHQRRECLLLHGLEVCTTSMSHMPHGFRLE